MVSFIRSFLHPSMLSFRSFRSSLPFLRQVPGKIRSKHDFTFDFQTSNPEGLIFFVAGDRQTDFISIYMKVRVFARAGMPIVGCVNTSNVLRFNHFPHHFSSTPFFFFLLRVAFFITPSIADPAPWFSTPSVRSMTDNGTR